MNKKLMHILVCPICKGKLEYIKKQNEMICQKDAMAYPVRTGIPVLLESDARKIEPSNNQ
ncbi:MAG: Trm112 family protein [Gammaproteobacteria bacterium]|nr:Trm112 family protein [Gammaproteobacteria bacterium]